MANFYAVIDTQTAQANEEFKRQFKNVIVTEQPKIARVVKTEGATTVAEVQEAMTALYPGLSTGTPVIITEAAYKTS